jgi:replication factor C subunit 3/5
MSDNEDDRMDVDSTIQFSSNNVDVKGKRTHANLPVEAEDTLPWYAINPIQCK